MSSRAQRRGVPHDGDDDAAGRAAHGAQVEVLICPFCTAMNRPGVTVILWPEGQVACCTVCPKSFRPAECQT